MVATGAIAVTVFATGAAIYKANQPQTVPAQTPAPANTLVRMHSPVIGPVDAPVTIVEFFDPSCEACRAFYPIVKQLLVQTGDKARLVLRYTPLHEGSDEVVRIIEAARRQDRFQPVLEALLERQPEWAVHGAPDIEKAWQIAASAGMDLTRGRQDAMTPVVDGILAQDIADMQANRIEQTPTFFVNGQPLTDFSPQGLFDLVKKEFDATQRGS
jgi:protein-disulfide isomerase